MKFKLLSSIILIAFSSVVVLNSSAYGQTGWTKKPDVYGQPSTKKVKGGGGITAMGTDVYLIIGNNTRDLMKYSTTSDSWFVASEVPIGPGNKKVKKGACIVNDGEYVYVFKGGGTNEFFRYHPIFGIWDSLSEPNFTKGVKGGFACAVESAGAKFIYAGSGSNTNEWKRYDIMNNLWETPFPETLPIHKVKIGSGLASDNSGNIYFLRGKGKENDFYCLGLNFTDRIWKPLKDLPFYVPGSFKKKKVKEGGCIEYANQMIYAVKGGNTKEFWYYSVDNDSWAYVGEISQGGASTPVLPQKGIKAGKTLTYSVAASGIFCVIGNNTNEFWYYPIGTLPMNLKGSRLLENTNVENAKNFAIRHNSRIVTGINYIKSTNDASNLKVYKVSGEFVCSTSSDKANALTGKLPSGVYILRYETKGYREDKKLIIAK